MARLWYYCMYVFSVGFCTYAVCTKSYGFAIFMGFMALFWLIMAVKEEDY